MAQDGPDGSGISTAAWWPAVTPFAALMTPATTLARHFVSGSKRRTQAEGYDLDLTYITPRIIALGLPASGLERLYRNPLSEVRDFLDGKHAGKYAMVNLCDERDYSNDDFPMAAKVFRFPFADHHPCTMAAMHAFCERAARFLAEDDEHVLAVHCKAGKGRTGVMICAYLLFAQIHTQAEQALHFFRSARTTDLDAVNNPSQTAYVRQYAALLAAQPSAIPRLLAGPTITLIAITLSSAPAVLYAAGRGSRSGGDGSSSGEGGVGAAALMEAVAAAAVGESPMYVTEERARKHETPQGARQPRLPEARSALSSLVVPPWHLKLAVSCVTTHDSDEGVRSTCTHICTLGPRRCNPSEPLIRFELPNGGLRAKGDLQLSLSATSLLAEDSELGWVHLHTSWMPAGRAPTLAEASISTVGGMGAGGHARLSSIGKYEMDGIGKDSRFPAEWKLLLQYISDEDDDELVMVERSDATASSGA